MALPSLYKMKFQARKLPLSLKLSLQSESLLTMFYTAQVFLTNKCFYGDCIINLKSNYYAIIFLVYRANHFERQLYVTHWFVVSWAQTSNEGPTKIDACDEMCLVVVLTEY